MVLILVFSTFAFVGVFTNKVSTSLEPVTHIIVVGENTNNGGTSGLI